MHGDDVIKEGDRVVLCLLRDTERYYFTKVLGNKVFRLGKSRCQLGDLVGIPFGSVFDVAINGKLRCLDETELLAEDTAIGPGHQDNRDLVDNNASQLLTAEDINTMKQEGTGCQQVVEALVQHSVTFASKSVFAQEKYIKKKKKRHQMRLKALFPSTAVIADACYVNRFSKHLCIRSDTLGQLLCAAGVWPGVSALVVEQCGGLVLGAVANRIGAESEGRVIFLDLGCRSPRPVLDYFPPKCLSPITSVSLEELRETHERLARSALLAIRLEPVSVLQVILPFLVDGSPFAVMHPLLQPLVDCARLLRSSSLACNLQLVEPLFREYQVLAGRTHPHMVSTADSGYILSGIKLTPEHRETDDQVPTTEPTV